MVFHAIVSIPWKEIAASEYTRNIKLDSKKLQKSLLFKFSWWSLCNSLIFNYARSSNAKKFQAGRHVTDSVVTPISRAVSRAEKCVTWAVPFLHTERIQCLRTRDWFANKFKQCCEFHTEHLMSISLPRMDNTLQPMALYPAFPKKLGLQLGPLTRIQCWPTHHCIDSVRFSVFWGFFGRMSEIISWPSLSDSECEENGK